MNTSRMIRVAAPMLFAFASLVAARTLPPAAAPQTVGAAVATSDGIVTGEDGRIQVFVELNDPAAAVQYAVALANTSLPKIQAKKNAVDAGKAQAQVNRAAQDRVAAKLHALNTTEVYRVSLVLNGISVMIDRANLASVRSIPGVKRVFPIYIEHTTSSQSVPFIGAPSVWANTIGLPAGADGTGIRIGIIDTGIDYLHADFGGSGLLADYNTESSNSAAFTTAGAFPTAKIIGGTDFAGDAYTGANAPVPDANPMDCNGHGSHVSGTAGGFGVTAAGATFAGPYDANAATYTPLRIVPGSAPKASLYALRVFGCTGSTGLTVQGIDWAMDPNGDSDLSDHLDVINMSLGSDFGNELNATALASDNAALAGVIVVTSAGNSGDTFFIAGAPGVASRAIATAASLDGGETVGSVKVNSPVGIAGSYIATIPAYGPVPSGQTATAVIALDAANGTGPTTTDACTALTNAAAIAGNICVVDRGTCSFKTKSLNCQNAGAIGVVAVDNAPGSPPAGTADDPAITTAITIPTLRITLADGTNIKSTITSSPPVNITLVGASGGDTLASFSSRGPRSTIGSALRLKPDIAAPGLNITSVQTGHTCTAAAGCTGVSDPSGFNAGSQLLVISGTSMASPHVAGVMALLRQLKPDWTVEEIKALAMDYAVNDVTLFPGATPPRFGLSRIGGGRVDPAKAALGNVVAMNAEDTGLVSVAFSPEVTGAVTQSKKVHIVNKGTTSQTFDLAFDTVVDAPGVAFALPGGNSVTIAAASTLDIDVQMNANSAQMKHTRDPSLFATQGVQANFGDQPRNFLTEKGAYLTFKQGGNLQFRLPVYMAERPASTMSAPDTIVTGGALTGSTTIALSGSDICTGTLAAGPTCTGTFPTDVESLVSPFELQVVGARNQGVVPDYADIHYAGASFLPGAGSPNLSNDLIMFGVASWGDWATPNDVAYDICVDNNNDGVYEKIIYNSKPSIFVANASANDNFVRIVLDTTTNGNSILGLASYANLLAPSTIDSAMHLNNVMVLGATPSQLGFVSTANQTLRYKIITCPGSNPSCARTTTGDHCSPAAGTFYGQAAGPYVYNWGAQGLNFGGSFLGNDLNGAALPVTWNTANMTTNGSLGALLLHHHNKSGTRAEVVVLDSAAHTDVAVTQSMAPVSPLFGQNVTFTVTANNTTATAAGNVALGDLLPNGLTYVSDDGGGAYSSSTGLWTIGALSGSATSTLHIVATVVSTDQQCNAAMLVASSPLDTNPANDSATVCVMAPRSADLAVTITASTPTVLVGAPLSYTITVTNNGGDTAYALNVQDAFPAYPLVNPTGFTASQGSYTPATGLWNLASLGHGASATLTISLPAPNIAGALTNQVNGASSANDPSTANNNASATTMVLSPALVSTTMSVAGSFSPGSTVTYTVALSNSANYDQQDNPGAEFATTLPAQLTLVSAFASNGIAVATVATNAVVWNGAVQANGSVTITITATINAGVLAGTQVSNQGTTNFDADGNGTNESTALSDDTSLPGTSNPTVFTVVSPALVSATKTVAGTFQPGGSVTYTVVLTNNGSSTQLDNPGNEFTDVLPAALALGSVNASSGTVTTASNTVGWNGSIAAGGSVTITILATINSGTAPGAISNQGTVAFDADGNGTNESTALTDDPGLPGTSDPTSFNLVSPATLSATKTVSGSFQVGTNVTYTIVISNTGSAAQLDNIGHEFVDNLPPALALISASTSSGTAVAILVTNQVTWDGSIAAGSSVTINIVAHILSTPVGQVVTNQGAVNFDADGDGSNESSAVTNDPSQPGSANQTVFTIAATAIAQAIPTLGSSSLWLLGTVLTLLAFLHRLRTIK
ncbi:DUF11 domain-containing protein [Pseudolysobacter antarcticus]|uniref:DUF11 domain-containing protein n=1 Tax=Pseudolysobacter antarcticus TaxID=2511995 RepID=A0A411HHR2_9GAMM|nr:S8 family serine peptidase [Pseudolysobacter antarcticus]QBB70058.1 DUF11 domain-containing protein [Pseudolysobacter antarcticus]